jgi:subtilisin family serine protease
MKRLNHLGCILTFSVLVFTGNVFATNNSSGHEFKHGEFIIKLSDGAQKNSLRMLSEDLAAEGIKIKRTLVENMKIYLATANSILDHEMNMEILSAHPQIEYVQKNHLLKRRGPNDPFLQKLWSLYEQASNSDIDAHKTWETTTGGKDKLGSDIVVAVVDGGVDLDHEDLVNNIWTNKKEIPGNNKDDDKNGYIDDIHGWNAYEENGQVDEDTHGTHVAGIIGAKGNNGVGIVGVNWDSKIMAVSLFDFSTAEVIRAYSYILKQKKIWLETNGEKGANVVATNSSFGVDRADCNSSEFQLWNDIYTKMGEVGIISAAATINSSIDVDEIGDVPTGCDSDYILTVTNTSVENRKNDYAGYGATSIDLGAPGTKIYSSIPNDNYMEMTGTSMATPHVAGAIALLHSAASKKFTQEYRENPAQMALTLKRIIMNNTDSLPSLEGITVTGGRLNVFKASQEISRY